MTGRTHDPRVEAAMRKVQRPLFLPEAQRSQAGVDAPLPIGFEQTISQPSLVAFMTEQLRLDGDTRVLEIGTGSGYQTAILAELAAEVFTIERIRDLGVCAAKRLTDLGYRNIRFKIGDGSRGWPDASPFAAIMVTAAAPAMPRPLLEQLQPGGRLIAPIGSTRKDNQELVFIEKDSLGRITRRDLGPVRFVPLVSDPPRPQNSFNSPGVGQT
jgi:protein-L-isoaspartate(D-aspartate) O-methyltransferase